MEVSHKLILRVDIYEMHWKHTVKRENRRFSHNKLPEGWDQAPRFSRVSMTYKSKCPWHHFLSWATLKAAEETFAGPGQSKGTLLARGKWCNNNHPKHSSKVIFVPSWNDIGWMILADICNNMFAGIWQLCIIIPCSCVQVYIIEKWRGTACIHLGLNTVQEYPDKGSSQESVPGIRNLGTSSSASQLMKVLHIHKSSICWPKHSLSR